MWRQYSPWFPSFGLQFGFKPIALRQFSPAFSWWLPPYLYLGCSDRVSSKIWRWANRSLYRKRPLLPSSSAHQWKPDLNSWRRLRSTALSWTKFWSLCHRRGCVPCSHDSQWMIQLCPPCSGADPYHTEVLPRSFHYLSVVVGFTLCFMSFDFSGAFSDLHLDNGASHHSASCLPGQERPGTRSSKPLCTTFASKIERVTPTLSLLSGLEASGPCPDWALGSELPPDSCAAAPAREP